MLHSQQRHARSDKPACYILSSDTLGHIRVKLEMVHFWMDARVSGRATAIHASQVAWCVPNWSKCKDHLGQVTRIVLSEYLAGGTIAATRAKYDWVFSCLIEASKEKIQAFVQRSFLKNDIWEAKRTACVRRVELSSTHGHWCIHIEQSTLLFAIVWVYRVASDGSRRRWQDDLVEPSRKELTYLHTSEQMSVISATIAREWERRQRTCEGMYCQWETWLYLMKQ